MKIPVHLQTLLGFEFYKKINVVYNGHKDGGSLFIYRQQLERERDQVEKEIDIFLHKDDFKYAFTLSEADKLGWSYFKEKSDMHTVLNYFSKRNDHGY